VRLPDAEVGKERFATGQPVTLAIRPEKIRLARQEELKLENCVTGCIEDLVYSGAETQYQLRVGEQRLKAIALNTRVGHHCFDLGSHVVCHLPEPALIPLDE
jgi:ABC-type Fe3+/spermidine/putrescine transport system ATPase subunit